MWKIFRPISIRERLESDLAEAQREKVKYERGLEEYAHWLGMLNSRIARIEAQLAKPEPVQATVSHLAAVPAAPPFPPLS